MREKMEFIGERLRKRADAIMNTLWHEYWQEFECRKKDRARMRTPSLPPLPYPVSHTARALYIMAEEIEETLSSLTFREAGDNDDDVFTLDDFKSHCDCRGFIDSDGHGCYATNAKTHINPEGKMMISNRPASPARFAGGDINRADFTHVIWYNK